MRFVRTGAALGVIVVLLLPQSGCLVAACAVGAGAGIAYVRGASVMTLEGTPQQVGKAAEAALSELGIAVLSTRVNDNGAEITARTQCDDKVSVCIEGCSCSTSEVTVRVGVFGDRHFQDRILGTISQKL